MSVTALFLAVAVQAPADALALQAMRNFADCVIAQSPAKAAELLATDPESDAYRNDLRRYIRGHDRCLPPGASLGTSSLPVAGALAEALIARGYKLDNLAAAAAAPKERLNEVTTVGQCVAEKDASALAAVLATTPGSKAEVAALNATGSLLTNCVKQGTKITLNRVSARAIYALGAYRTFAGPALPPPTANNGITN